VRLRERRAAGEVVEVVQVTVLGCKTCGKDFRRPPKSNRLHCEACRPPRARGLPGTKPVSAPPVLPAAPEPASIAAVPAPAARIVGEMEQAVLDELRLFGRQGSVSGVAAILMARQVDNGLNTGSQLATLMAKVQQAVDQAVSGVAPKGDTLDELQQQRAARIAAAG
jgi:hypothetical protein